MTDDVLLEYTGLTQQVAVGEIRAVRTFRVEAGSGWLWPLYLGPPWEDGVNEAVCRRAEATGPRFPGRLAPAVDRHRAPDEGCRCGFYAYADPRRTRGQRTAARRVLAVMAASGVVIAGTRGIRAERARLEAVWVSSRLGATADLIRARYPSAEFFTDRAAMFGAHPLTRLDCYGTRLWLLGRGIRG